MEICATRMESLRQVLSEQAQREEELESRYPWVPILFKRVCAFLLAALLLSGFTCWVIDKSNARDKALEEQAVKKYQAMQLAAEEEETARKKQEAQSEENIILAEATDCAKALYGIRLFVEKYGYTEKDLKTYLRSAFNRADARGKSLHDVLSEKDQYLAYSDSNTVLTEFKAVALSAVREWHAEKEKPCDLAYQFAELKEDGVWLVKDINADGYARRWHAS